MKSARYVLFATIPPTFAAAKITYSGFSFEKISQLPLIVKSNSAWSFEN